MNFFLTFKFSALAIAEIFLIGLAGFVLARKGIISTQGLKTLSRLVVEVSLPALIFSRLLSDFNFQRFPDWWLFPLISFGLTLFGLAIGYLFLKADKSLSQKNEFLGLIAFQNSGYLPLALAATILPPSEADQMFIYIFLFLLGFNALIWSFGVHLLSKHRGKRFEFGSVFTPPLWATLGALLIIFLKAESFVPRIVLKPLAMLGACAIPLGLMIVGGSLAFVSSEGKIRKRSLINLGLGKLIILPILVFLFIIWIKPPRLIGLLLLVEAMMPSATSLSIIAQRYSADCDFVNQSILWTHLLSLITIPLFLSLFRYFVKFLPDGW
ncbi:MAG: AEC family transporter [Candidatus Omnitrophica bacterium]|nr:AEC family transporter [Candidatus Omnitrophota bacterium]